MLRNFQLISITVFLVATFAACSKLGKLQKKWIVTDVEFIFENRESQQTADTLLQEITKNVLKKLLLHNVYDFKTDNTCNISGNNHTTTFSYKLIKMNRFIQFSNEDSSKEVEVEALSDDELIIITHNDQSSIKTRLKLKPYHL